ncbi:hypothetical protein niasHT_000023 [Heterodera trifolii]|uniref:Uncharacterized protein n=1 Tax=Heterodera trifolii TaxID=157864 RepID=A0ABD2M8T8_9BILA
MAKRKLISELQNKKAAQKRWDKREERKAQTKRATEARLAKKTAPQPNPNAETPQQDEAGPSTSAAPTEEAMEPPPPTPGPVPTPEMDDELLDFGDLVPSTSATPIGDLVPFPSTPTAPMDTGEMTPPPLVIDDRSERIEQLEIELKDRDDTIQFLREQVRNRDALITALRRQLEQCAPPPTATPTTSKTTPTGRPKKNVDHLERTSRRKLAEEIATERMRGFLSKKPKSHLLLSHFVPFAREHKFLGLLDEQGDEALHSVWRRLEQLWKCMPDADQILQQLEHHFVNNWLLDTGKIDEMKQRQSDQRDENDEFEQSEEETDEMSLINVID